MKRTMTRANEKMAATSEKLEGLVFRLQNRKEKKEKILMHWEVINNKLVDHWDKTKA